MRTLAFLLLLAGVTAPLAGQQAPVADSVHHRNDCRLAGQVVRTGHPAPHLRWALGVLHQCGASDFGDAVSDAATRLRGSSDTVALAQVWNVSQSLIDARFAETALAIARDRTATVPARVFAIGALINMAQVGRVWGGYGSVTGGFVDEGSGEVRGGCGRARVADDHRTRGRDLPADFSSRTRALRDQLWRDATEPEDVRTAAACL